MIKKSVLAGKKVFCLQHHLCTTGVSTPVVVHVWCCKQTKKIPPLPPQGSPAGSPAEQVAPSGGATSGVGIAFVFFPSFSFLFNSGRSPREFLLGLTRKNTEKHGTTLNKKHGKHRKTRTNIENKHENEIRPKKGAGFVLII